jgi:hypothetical protein
MKPAPWLHLEPYRRKPSLCLTGKSVLLGVEEVSF